MAPVYFSPDPFHKEFEETLDMRRYGAYDKPTGGMVFEKSYGQLVLQNIVPSSPAAKIPAWRTRIRGDSLWKVGQTLVESEDEVVTALASLHRDGVEHCNLVFSHPEVSPGLANDGIPQVNLGQMNPRHMMNPSFCSATMVGTQGGSFIPDQPHNVLNGIKESGGLLNYMSKAMKLTRGKLMRGEDWDKWRVSEWKQLDQYEQQGMFGDPIQP